MPNDWTTQTGRDLGSSVVEIGRALWRDDAGRRTRMLDCVSRYENRRLASLDPQAYRSSVGLETNEEEVRWNLCRSLVATATAKIAGGQQPKVAFVASNADWTTRRKGPKLDAFITGLWGTRQEPYADIWELGVAAFRDAAVCGIGAIKVWSDVDLGRVLHERVFPWELLVDPDDGKYGAPGNLWHVYTVPRSTLLAVFPESAVDIEAARAGSQEDDPTVSVLASSYLGSRKVVEPIRCYEWWSLPKGPDSPGKHVLAIDGGACLIEEEWTRDSFPVALIRWDREFQGWHGTSLVEEVAAIDDELNDILGRLARCVRLTSIAKLWVPDGSKVTGDIIDNEDATVGYYDGPTPPTVDNPEPFSPAHVDYLQMMRGAGYEMTGINQMSATAQKQTGLDSGAAIRMVADLQSERFAVAWKAYQSLFVEIARHDIACVRELAMERKDFAVRWPGNGFLREIRWADVDLADDMYVIQIASAPSIKGTPADRLQTATELYSAGQLSADALMAIRQTLDLPGEMDRASRQRNVIESYIERWLDATPEEVESGKASDGGELFRPPIRFMRLEDALLQVADAYLQAELDGVPDVNKELFLRWIELADVEIVKRQQRVQALPPPAPGPMPGAPMPPPPGGPLA